MAKKELKTNKPVKARKQESFPNLEPLQRLIWPEPSSSTPLFEPNEIPNLEKFYSIFLDDFFAPERWANQSKISKEMWDWFVEILKEFAVGAQNIIDAATKLEEAWPVSKKELCTWLDGGKDTLGLTQQVHNLADIFIEMFETLVIDVEEREKQRQRGRELAQQINKRRKVPDSKVAQWRQQAKNLQKQYGWSNWSIAM